MAAAAAVAPTSVTNPVFHSSFAPVSSLAPVFHSDASRDSVFLASILACCPPNVEPQQFLRTLLILTPMAIRLMLKQIEPERQKPSGSHYEVFRALEFDEYFVNPDDINEKSMPQLRTLVCAVMEFFTRFKDLIQPLVGNRASRFITWHPPCHFLFKNIPEPCLTPGIADLAVYTKIICTMMGQAGFTFSIKDTTTRGRK